VGRRKYSGVNGPSSLFFSPLESPAIRPATNGENFEEKTLDVPASLKFLQLSEDREQFDMLVLSSWDCRSLDISENDGDFAMRSLAFVTALIIAGTFAGRPRGRGGGFDACTTSETAFVKIERCSVVR